MPLTSKRINYAGQEIPDTGFPAPSPQYGPYNQTQSTPHTAPPPPFDMAAMLAAFAQMAQQQGQMRLQSQREAIGSGDVIGEQNKRRALIGSAWNEGFFKSRDDRLASEERAFGADRGGALARNMDRMNYTPPTGAFGDAAVQASLQHPYAAELRAMPAQNPFIGMAPPRAQYAGPGMSQNYTNPPRATQVPLSKRKGSSFSFGASAYPR